jgi:hypothetical protein
MAVASSIDVNDGGMGWSLDEVEGDRCEESVVLDGVRGRLLRCTAAVRELRLGGITTGEVFPGLGR